MTLCIILMMFIGSITSAFADAGVTRSIFTTAIENREPVSDLKQIMNDATRAYYFTEITGFKGHVITHRWEYNEKVMAAVSFTITSDRWRTWSSKNMLASWTGTWHVSVLDEGGNVIEQTSFEYVAPAVEGVTATP